MGIVRTLAACTLATFVLGACLSTFEGTPERFRTPDQEVEALRPLLDRPVHQVDSPEMRNAIIGARLFVADLQFTEFENRLLRENRDVNFALALTGLGVGTAGGLISGVTSNILSGINAVIEGTDEAFNQEILLDQTVQMLLTQMQANRQFVLTRIYQRLDRSLADYPMTFALADIEAYYQAGTLASALTALNETAAAELAENTSQAESEISVYRVRTTADPSATTPEHLATVSDLRTALETIPESCQLIIAADPPGIDVTSEQDQVFQNQFPGWQTDAALAQLLNDRRLNFLGRSLPMEHLEQWRQQIADCPTT